MVGVEEEDKALVHIADEDALEGATSIEDVDRMLRQLEEDGTTPQQYNPRVIQIPGMAMVNRRGIMNKHRTLKRTLKEGKKVEQTLEVWNGLEHQPNSTKLH
jgi:hypothetical protein